MRILSGVMTLSLAIAGCDGKDPVPTATALTPAAVAAGAPDPEPQQGGSAIEEARKLMAEAGFPAGKGFPRLELLYNTNEAHKKIASAVQQMWKQALGIDVELRNSEWKVYLDQLTRVDYHIARRGWIADYPDPNTFLDLFLSKSGNNNTKWANADFDKLIEDASREKDPARRLKILQSAEKFLMDEMPIIPIYFYVSQQMWRAETRGLFENPLSIHPLKEVVHGDGSKPFIFNAGAEPQTLDPNLQRGSTEHRININLFEGLTSYHPKTLEAQPGVAQSWSVSEDGRTWTFKLRECAWTSGRPVTAHDFVYAWRRGLDPAVASDYAYILFGYLRNGKAYYDGATADLSLRGFGTLPDDKRLEVARELPKQVQPRHADSIRQALSGEKNGEIAALLKEALTSAPERRDVKVGDVGVRATDERTLVVDLESPTPYFLYLTSFFSYYPVPREAVEKHGDRWTRPENIVSNGPFRMKVWVPNDHILVERNPGYWDAAKVRQQQIKFIPIDNVNTAFNMFTKNQCDFLDTVPTEFIEELRKDPNFHTAPYLTTYFYSMNVAQMPLDDKRVRRALGLVINREKIADKILRGGQAPAYSVVPPGLAGYESQVFFSKGK